MTKIAGVFDISSPKLFFDLILREYEALKLADGKSTAQLMFVVMGLNHLREWIAVGYEVRLNGKENPPDSSKPEQVFSKAIYDHPPYDVLRKLCNHTKHVKNVSTDTGSNVSIDEWESIDSVVNFDVGMVREYRVDGSDLFTILDDVIGFYRVNWFK